MVSLAGDYAGLYGDSVMMRKWLVVVIILLAGVLSMGAAPNIKEYREKLVLAPDGSGRETIQIVMTDLVAGDYTIPLPGQKGIKEFQWEASEGVKVRPVLTGDVPYVALTYSSQTPQNVSLSFSYQTAGVKLPAVSTRSQKTLSYRFLNAGSLPMAKYQFCLLLAEGDVIHSVQEVLPKSQKGDGAKIAYIKETTRQGLVLDAVNLKFSDAASVKLTVQPGKKSPVMLWLGIMLAGLYLYYFRDIVRKD